VNIEDPANPYLVGYHDSPGISHGVALSGGLAFVTDYSEFSVYDITAALPALDNSPALPAEVALRSAYPNPFNPVTTIAFDLPQAGNVELKVFNMLGQTVAELINEALPAGTHTVNFNATGLASGSYFYTLNTGSQLLTKQMVLVK
jgi:hypothetical protein